MVVRLICIPVILLAILAEPSLGRNPYRKNFFKAYPSAKGSVLDTVPSHPDHCGVCHYDFGGSGAKNPYGQAVEATDRSAAAIKGVGAADSDGDGFSNDVEITDTQTFGNVPTFPGLKPANVGSTVGVDLADIQSFLVPSAGNDTQGPDVVVVRPNGGELVIGNDSTPVEWTASDDGGVAAVDIYVSLDGGAMFKPVALGIGNSGSYEWFAANRPTLSAIIRVEAIDNSFNKGQDQSDSVFTVAPPEGGLAPTTLRDFDMPGSQPFEAGTLNHPDACRVCHGDYDTTAEPFFNWQGSMMALASHDMLFKANMVIANQDAPDSGDLCLRCHLARGWLRGRSVPTDGSAMLATDESGVSCDLCHRLVDPISSPDNPAEDAAILADLVNAPSETGNGMYVVDPTGARRGPFLNATSGHPVLVSPFHREAALCGTCHDVSNTAFENDAEGNYVPNAFDAPATDMSPTKLLPVERTYSEWLHSAYNSAEGVYAPQFGGNKGFVATCQDCHMRDVTGKGCNPALFETVPERNDLPLHDMTGGSTWMGRSHGSTRTG